MAYGLLEDLYLTAENTLFRRVYTTDDHEK